MKTVYVSSKNYDFWKKMKGVPLRKINIHRIRSNGGIELGRLMQDNDDGYELCRVQYNGRLWSLNRYMVFKLMQLINTEGMYRRFVGYKEVMTLRRDVDDLKRRLYINNTLRQLSEKLLSDDSK